MAILRYVVDGGMFETRCDPQELKLVVGNRYLLKYANEIPEHYQLLGYMLMDSIEAPKERMENGSV